MAITRLKVNRLPKFVKGKTHVDMRMVRPIDINGVIDEINTEFTTTNGNVATNTSAIATINNKYTYAEVSMSAAQILAADNGGSGAFQLLPDPGDGSYYIFDEFITEYTHVTTNYSGATGGTFEVQMGGYPIVTLDKAMFESIGANSFIIAKSGSPNNGTAAETMFPVFSGAVTVLHQDLNGWSAGDGTLLFKMRYRLETPGTAL